MRYIECPNELGTDNDYDNYNSLFIAGGITSCPLWQPELVKLLEDTDITILNPRRSNFGDTRAQDQIAWEFKYLSRVEMISFWFPKETLCPITLFEYGKVLAQESLLPLDFIPKRKIFVGCHPEYQRKEDLIIQTGLMNLGINIVHSLEDLAEQIKEYV